MKYLKVLSAAAVATLSLQSTLALAEASCPITNFEVQQYEYGTPFVTGYIGGNFRYIYLCTGSGTTNTCDSQGTNRNVAMAMTAFATGKPLHAYFVSSAITACNQVVDYTRPFMFRLIP
jgi:hypothetical protein